MPTEFLNYRDYVVAAPSKPSQLVPGLVVRDLADERFVCPKCKAARRGLSHGVPASCAFPDCGLRFVVHGNQLRIWSGGGSPVTRMRRAKVDGSSAARVWYPAGELPGGTDVPTELAEELDRLEKRVEEIEELFDAIRLGRATPAEVNAGRLGPAFSEK